VVVCNKHMANIYPQDIFEKLSETHGQNFSRLFNNENWVSRHVQGRHSQSQPSFVRPACNFISADIGESTTSSKCQII
jgi:hypothetical protein